MANKNPSKKWRKGGPIPKSPGRPALPGEVRELRKMTIEQLKDIISLVMACSYEELEQMANDDKATVIQRMAASLAKITIKKGNTFAWDALLNRVIGKPREEIKILGSTVQVVQVEMPKKRKVE